MRCGGGKGWGGVGWSEVEEEGRVGRGQVTSFVQQPTARDRQPPLASATRSASAVISAHVSGLCARQEHSHAPAQRDPGGIVRALGLGVRPAQWLRGGLGVCG